MRARITCLGVATVALWLSSLPAAGQGVAWQPTLDTARRVAGQTDRLVLVHFWAEWCRPCARMDQDVFSRPDVAAALETSYVPVKIKREDFPYTASQFGVTAVPTDVILSPQGQVIDKFTGAADAAEYVGRLSQVAARFRSQAVPGYAQMAGPPPVAAPQGEDGRYGPPPGPAMPPPVAGGGVPAGYTDDRYADVLRGQAPGQPSAVGPRYAGPAYGAQAAPSPTLPPLPLPTQPPAASQPPYAQGGEVPWPADPGASVPPGSQPAAPADRQPWVGGTPMMYDRAAGQQQAPSPQRPAIDLPPGSPPLALDGYCPVSLTERERWVLGNRRWGAYHEGRTYLFAGPEEQRRFLATPERYAPALSGKDVVIAVEQGQMVSGHREFGGWFGGRMYLFASEASYQKFEAEPRRYLEALAQMQTSMARRPAGPYGPPAAPSTSQSWRAQGTYGGAPY